MADLATFVQQRRAELGLSLQGLADRAFCSKAHIWEIEQGKAGDPTISMLCKLAAALQISAPRLFRIASHHDETRWDFYRSNALVTARVALDEAASYGDDKVQTICRQALLDTNTAAASIPYPLSVNDTELCDRLKKLRNNIHAVNRNPIPSSARLRWRDMVDEIIGWVESNTRRQPTKRSKEMVAYFRDLHPNDLDGPLY